MWLALWVHLPMVGPAHRRQGRNPIPGRPTTGSPQDAEGFSGPMPISPTGKGQGEPARGAQTRTPSGGPRRSAPVYKESMTHAPSAANDNRTSSTCSAFGSTPASHAGHPGFEPQHVHIPPQGWTLSNVPNLSNLSNLSPSMDLDKDRVACSQSKVTQGHYPSEPPDTVLGRIYIPPPLPTATPQQLCSLCSPVPPPKRRRANPPEYCENI